MTYRKAARRSLIKGLLGILVLIALLAIDVALLVTPDQPAAVHVVVGYVRT